MPHLPRGSPVVAIARKSHHWHILATFSSGAAGSRTPDEDLPRAAHAGRRQPAPARRARPSRRLARGPPQRAPGRSRVARRGCHWDSPRPGHDHLAVAGPAGCLGLSGAVRATLRHRLGRDRRRLAAAHLGRPGRDARRAAGPPRPRRLGRRAARARGLKPGARPRRGDLGHAARRRGGDAGRRAPRVRLAPRGGARRIRPAALGRRPDRPERRRYLRAAAAGAGPPAAAGDARAPARARGRAEPRLGDGDLGADDAGADDDLRLPLPGVRLRGAARPRAGHDPASAHRPDPAHLHRRLRPARMGAGRRLPGDRHSGRGQRLGRDPVLRAAARPQRTLGRLAPASLVRRAAACGRHARPQEK